MPIFTSTPVRPAQQNQAGALNALSIEEYTGDVEHTIERKSVVEPQIALRSVQGTNTLTSFAIGATQMQVLTPGQAPDGTPVDFSKNSVTISAVPMARNILPTLEEFQTSYDARKEIAVEQGRTIAKFRDQAFLIQATRAALATESSYNGGTTGKPTGYSGGSIKTLAAAADRTDPAKLYAAIGDLFANMEGKDVSPQEDDIGLYLKPTDFYTLLKNEQIINGQYVTADGTKIDNQLMLKAWGVPVFKTNNVPSTNIASHLLGTSFVGDFSKVVAVAFSPRALLAGETIPVQSKVWQFDLDKQWYVDSWFSFGIAPNRNEYAGAILLP